MKNKNKKISQKPVYQEVFPFVLLMALLIVITGCNTMTLVQKDKSTGINGGFEVVKKDLPVNWYFISPLAIKNKAYEIILDSSDIIEGRYALKYLVHEVDKSRNIWKNPGMFNTLDGDTGETYKINFWIKNKGCSFRIKMRSENHPLEYEEIIIESSDTIDNWQFFEYEYMIPMEYDRFGLYLHIWEPGSFWIDDVRIKKIMD